jgi:3-hydroxyisobutyrate dehydrogenase-like beta-hydroxyacid dehydrogenase
MSRTERVAVIGVGLLGRGIARVAARAGFDVVVYDHDSDVSRRVVDDLGSHGLDVRRASSIDEAATGADYLIEAVIEDLAIKQLVFAQAGAAAPSAILVDPGKSCRSRTAGTRPLRWQLHWVGVRPGLTSNSSSRCSTGEAAVPRRAS